MLARTYGPRFERFPCFVQPKLNGVRALYQNGAFQSRDSKLWKPNVLRHLVSELEPLDHILQGRMLDGELYVHGWRLQKINGAIAVNRNEPCEDTLSIEYHVFDSPHTSRFSQRWLELGDELRNCAEHVKIVDTSLVHNRTTLDQWFHFYTAQGYEGVMLRPDGPYELGETSHGTTKRSEYLWKYKSWEDGEFVCIGVTQGEGKADIGIGALTCVTDSGNAEIHPGPTFNVGTGFSDEDRIHYMKNPPLGKQVKVRYLCLSADGIPLNPSFLAVLE